MAEVLHFTGFIKGVTYKTYLDDNLNRINLDIFDVNKERGYGLIKSPTTEIAYSKWVSPKRTRSYPQKIIIKKLALEAKNNQKLKIEVSSNF
ncbi:hypothetical protein [uncultured Nostoc sp.]|uniref:hypothetical protein n=1 Tax=uncultured Nostoc sp. TaxID=340711 RepID=UPI0035CC8AF3